VIPAGGYRAYLHDIDAEHVEVVQDATECRLIGQIPVEDNVSASASTVRVWKASVNPRDSWPATRMTYSAMDLPQPRRLGV
jgi:hypothetical protein